MIDLAPTLSLLYSDLLGWSVVDNEIVEWPDGVPMPTDEELEQAWAEIQQEQAEREVREKRRQRYQQETDDLLYEALEKVDLPELSKWQTARKKIKDEIPMPEQVKGKQ